jgi:hypothetical protein
MLIWLVRGPLLSPIYSWQLCSRFLHGHYSVVLVSPCHRSCCLPLVPQSPPDVIAPAVSHGSPCLSMSLLLQSVHGPPVSSCHCSCSHPMGTQSPPDVIAPAVSPCSAVSPCHCSCNLSMVPRSLHVIALAICPWSPSLLPMSLILKSLHGLPVSPQCHCSCSFSMVPRSLHVIAPAVSPWSPSLSMSSTPPTTDCQEPAVACN